MKRIRRSPHGERGLKCALRGECLSKAGSRSPHGERGLKFFQCIVCVVTATVALLMESVD